MKHFEPADPDDFLIVYHREQARAYPQFKPEQVISYLTPWSLRGRTPRRIFRTGLGQSRKAYETLALIEQYAYTGTEIHRIEHYDWVVNVLDYSGPCFICGDKRDHYGQPHGEVTGDGRVRADVEVGFEPQWRVQEASWNLVEAGV